MKTYYALLLPFLFTSLISNAQTLKEDKVDEFTKHAVKRTSWEKIIFNMKLVGHQRISKIDDNYYFDLKLMITGGLNARVFAIGQDQELMLKLADAQIIKLPSVKGEVACTGCGAVGLSGSSAPGVDISYRLTKEQVEQLKAGSVVKFRVYTTDGYVEDDIKDKNAEKITKALTLVN